MRQKMPFIISVSMEITPPLTPTVPIYNTIRLSKKGLNRPTAHTSGITTRSL